MTRLYPAHLRCRYCGEEGPFEDVREDHGGIGLLMPCGHWMRWPDPDEVVLWDPEREVETWGKVFPAPM